MSDLTTDDLRRMTPAQVAKLDQAEVNRVVSGAPKPPENADELRALTPAQVRQLDPADVNRILGGDAA